MRPQRFDGADHTLKLEGGTEENDLPCQIEDGWTISRWAMSDEERATIASNGGLLVAWLWWTNLIGVQVRIDGVTAPDEPARHTEETMAFSGLLKDDTPPSAGMTYFGLTATLDEAELSAIAQGANVELRVDMHPTCPVGIEPARF